MGTQVMTTTPLGRRLRELRLRAGLNQAELARAVGVDPSYVSMIEHGKKYVPRRETMVAMAKALEVPVEELLAAAGYIVPENVPDSGPPLAKVIEGLQATLDHLRSLTPQPPAGGTVVYAVKDGDGTVIVDAQGSVLGRLVPL